MIFLHLHVTTSPKGSKSSLWLQFCRLSRTRLTLLSLMAQRVGGAEKPFIFGRHNMQWKRNREAHGMCEMRGGCHLCEGTSKDSSADVSKQDGCQVGSVDYLGNKKWLTLRFFNTVVFFLHLWTSLCILFVFWPGGLNICALCSYRMPQRNISTVSCW